MVQKLNINPKILDNYIKMSNIPLEILEKSVPNIRKFLSGESLPTFNQLSKLAKLINIPTGLLLLNEKVNIEGINLDFRTIKSKPIEEMSLELRDTILEMQDKQDFLKEEIETECPFVGLFNFDSININNINEFVVGIEQYIGNDIGKDRFENYREKIGNLGVFIFLNGKVKDNTHRPLSINEFRGFVLADKKAPIIFINQKDSKAGRLFTLIHEFVHLFFGESSLLNKDILDSKGKEAIINKITGEILVPKTSINEKYDTMKSVEENIDYLKDFYEVSKFVIARRLLDIDKISKNHYYTLISRFNDELDKIIKVKTSSDGGNYKNNLKYRIDKNFFNYVNNAVLQNRLSYTDAFNIVGVKYNGYKILTE